MAADPSHLDAVRLFSEYGNIIISSNIMIHKLNPCSLMEGVVNACFYVHLIIYFAKKKKKHNSFDKIHLEFILSYYEYPHNQ